jgi:hypothetical protein
VPPPATTVAEPLLLPQEAWVNEVLAVIGVGWVIVTVAVAEHPFLSFTVTV